MKRHRRGSGCVFTAGSKTKWIRYYVNGRAITENTHSTDQKTAEGILQARIYEVGQGSIVPDSGVSKITVGSLYEEVARDYSINERKSTCDLKMRWENHLKPFFGHFRPANVSSDLVARYIDQRKQEGAANASINRELAVLKRAFHLGRQCTPPKVRVVPYFQMLKENNVRTGFLEIGQYESLARACAKIGLWMRTLFELGFTYGWRHAELLGLHVDQVSIVERTIRLDPGRTKNDKGREVTLTPLLCKLLQECIRGKQPHEHLITRDDGSHVADFRESWERVIKGAGVPDLLFHDLRRTAVRNMIRAGISERVAMEISGHKTRSVFDRYNITSQADISDAVQKLVSQRSVRVESEIAELPAIGQTSAERLN
jgi:integrase